MSLDTKTKLRAQLLARDAVLAAIAFHKKGTDQFLLVLIDEYQTPKGRAAVKDGFAQGFAPLAMIALRSTPDGLPLIEDEPLPGALDEDVQKARRLFRHKLIEGGILKIDDVVN